MAAMNVTMTLTLQDAASGPLRAFTALVAALEKAVNSLNPRLQAAVDGINAMGAAAAKATAGVDAMAKAASTTAAAADQSASAFSAMSSALVTVAERAVAAVTAITEVGNAARVSATAVEGAGVAMQTGFAAANTQATSLGQTIKGLTELWAAFKIEKGLKESATEAISYQATQNRLATMNIAPDDRARMVAAATATSAAIPQFNQNEMLTMAIDLRNATGSVDEALHMLPQFATAAFNMKMATPEGKGFSESDMLLVAKALEQRNATMDPQKLTDTLDIFTKIYTATQGRVDASSLLGNLQYAKGGLGQTMDLSFLPMFAAMIEQVKSAGGNGGQIGTWLTTLQNSVLTGTGKGSAQSLRAEMGLINPDGLVWNRQGNIDQRKSNLTMTGADEFQKNPYEWVQNYLKPALVRAGIDLTNDAAVNATLNKLFPDRNAANVASMMVTRGPLLEKDAGNINQALDNSGQYAQNVTTAKANIAAFQAQLENLAIVMGTTLLPAITKIAEGFTVAFGWLAAFFQDHPIAAEITTWAVAIAAVGLALAGFATLFATLGIPALFGGITAAAATLIGGIAAWAGVLTGITELIGIFFLAWKFGELLGSVDVFGKSLQERMTDVIEWMVDAWSSAWGFIGRGLASLFPAAAAAEARGAAGPYGSIDSGKGNGWDSTNPLANRPIDSGKGDGWGNAFTNVAFDFGKGNGWGGVPKRTGGGTGGTDGGGGRARTGRAKTAANDDGDPMGDFITGKLPGVEVATQTRLEKELADFRRNEAKASGERHQAELIHIQAEIQAHSQELIQAGLITQAEVDQAIAKAQAASEFGYQQQQAQGLRDAEKRSEQEINDEVSNGLKTTLDGQNEKYQLRQIEAQQLAGMIDQLRALAEASGDPRLMKQVEDMAVQVKGQLGELSPVMKDLKNNFDTSFTGFFEGILSGTKSGKAAFKDLFTSIKQGIDQFVSKALSDMLTKFLFGTVAGGSGGALNQVLSGVGSSTGGSSNSGMGGLFGQAAGLFKSSGAGSWFSGLFGGGSASAGIGAATASDVAAAGEGLMFLATGTNYVPQDMVAMIHEGEAVVPKEFNPAAGGQSPAGVRDVHNHFTIPANMPREAQTQVAYLAGQGVSRAVRRNG